MAIKKSLFDNAFKIQRYFLIISVAVLFVAAPSAAWPAIQHTPPGIKNPFDTLRSIPQKNRFSAAETIYKDRSNLRRAQEDQAMAAFDALTILARSLNDKSLECQVFDMRADYYAVNNGFNPLSIKWYQQAIDFSAAQNLVYDNGFYLHRMGAYYAIFKHNAQACRYFLQSQDVFNRVGYRNIPGIGVLLSQVADFYYALGDYENARLNLESALRYMPANAQDRINILNTIGLIYRSYRQFPQAIVYFNKAIAIAAPLKDTVWMGIAEGNIGSVFFLQNQYKKALPYIQNDYKISFKYGEFQNGVIALLRLVKINIDGGEPRKAKQQLDTVQHYLNEDRSDRLDLRADYYNLRSQLCEQLRLPEDAIAYRKKYEEDKDSLTKRNNIAGVERVKLRYEFDKHAAAILKFKTDARLHELKIWAIVGLLSFLIIIAILLYYNQRIKQRKDKALLLAEKKVVDEELRSAEEALKHFTENLRQKNILIEGFKKEIEQLRSQSANIDTSKIIGELLDTHLMTEADWLTFKKLFTKVYPGFFISLNKKYPLLSDTEIRMLTLIKLGLNNTEMANMLGITIDGILKSKQRLRKKIDISTISDLEFEEVKGYFEVKGER